MPARTCHALTHEDYVGAVAAEIQSLATTVDAADGARRVPSCPDWNLHELVTHVGQVHRWAEHLVRVRAPERIPSDEMDIDAPTVPADYAAWLRAGADRLTATLRGVDPATPMWAWGLDQTAGFWARRQLHETVMHHVDAQLALDHEPEVDAATAVDGIDEFLDNLPCAARFSPGVVELRGTGQTLHLHATGGEACWTITRGADGFTWEHEHGPADTTMTAPIGDLLLFTYGRRTPDQVAVDGDPALLAHWVAHSTL